jgi:hypothetical protein
MPDFEPFGHATVEAVVTFAVVVEPLGDVRDDGSLEAIELIDPAGRSSEPRLEIG